MSKLGVTVVLSAGLTSGIATTRRVGAAPAERPPAMSAHPTSPSITIHSLRCMASSSTVFGYGDRGRPTRSATVPLEAPQRPDDGSARCARALYARYGTPSCVRGHKRSSKRLHVYRSPPGGMATPALHRQFHAQRPPLSESGHRRGDTMILRCIDHIVSYIMDNVNYFSSDVLERSRQGRTLRMHGVFLL